MICACDSKLSSIQLENLNHADFNWQNLWKGEFLTWILDWNKYILLLEDHEQNNKVFVVLCNNKITM